LVTITPGPGSGDYKKGKARESKTGSINNKKRGRERETPNPVKVNYRPVWQDRKFGALLWDD
jgi:hypothetical protein